MTDLKTLRELSAKFAQDNLRQRAMELLVWQDTGILCDGYVRKLARMCGEWAGSEHSLQIAKSFINRAALENVYERL